MPGCRVLSDETSVPRKLGVLISGRGSNLQALIDAVADGRLPAPIRVVISNRADAAGLRARASRGHRDAGPPAPRLRVARRLRPRARRRAAVARRATACALPGSCGCSGPAFCEAFPHAVAQHPSVAAAGVSGRRRAARRRSSTACKVTGATVHFVTPELDAGPIVMQAAVPVRDDDTAETLSARILEVEHRLYPEAVQRVLDGGWRSTAGVSSSTGGRVSRVRLHKLTSMTVDEQLAYLTKGCVDVVRAGELRAKLERSRDGQPLTVKVGFDPDGARPAPRPHRAASEDEALSGPRASRHLPHRRLHRADRRSRPADRRRGRRSRPRRSPPTPRRTRRRSSRSSIREKTVVDFNARWLSALGAEGLVRLAARYNVAQMLERRDFKQRFEAGKPIAVHEFLYPLAQAYDSVFLKADVELGGTDQLFNLNVGRDIMPGYGLEAQVVMTTPLLEGLDGVEKMSKSLGNYVGVTEPPDEMFGKLMSISDELMWRYYLLLTDLIRGGDRRASRRRWPTGASIPKQAKVDLAKRIVADFHSARGGRARGRGVRGAVRARRAGGRVAAGGVGRGRRAASVALSQAGGRRPGSPRRRARRRARFSRAACKLDREKVTDTESARRPDRRRPSFSKSAGVPCGSAGQRQPEAPGHED